MDIEVIRQSTRILIQRIDAYFQSRGKLPTQCTSNSQCNAKFMGNDITLAQTTNEIITKMNQKKAYSFSIGFTQFPNGCKLMSKCCSCPSRPNPYYDKNSIRNSAENKLKKWLSAARKWLNEGGKELKEEQTTYKRSISGALKVKKFGYGNLND